MGKMGNKSLTIPIWWWVSCQGYTRLSM